jgi:hypothetical protein
MIELLLIAALLIALIAAAASMHPTVRRQISGWGKALPAQGIIKRDWLPTGRIDFATQLSATPSADSNNQQGEFRLLVEERRIVESIAGNENLEIQWRLATLKEAKAVVTLYHKYLAEKSIIKSYLDDSARSPEPMTARGSPSPDLDGGSLAPVSPTSRESEPEIQATPVPAQSS